MHVWTLPLRTILRFGLMTSLSILVVGLELQLVGVVCPLPPKDLPRNVANSIRLLSVVRLHSLRLSCVYLFSVTLSPNTDTSPAVPILLLQIPDLRCLSHLHLQPVHAHIPLIALCLEFLLQFLLLKHLSSMIFFISSSVFELIFHLLVLQDNTGPSFLKGSW